MKINMYFVVMLGVVFSVFALAPVSAFADVTTGSITICKIIQDGDNTTSGEAGSTFTIPFVDANYEGPAAAVPLSAVFTTPLSPLQNVFGSVQGKCLPYTELNLGTYYYGEEQVSSIFQWETPKYNDQAGIVVSNLSELQSFNPDLDPVYNNFDGVITLTADNPNRTLLVLNKVKVVDVCPNIDGNQSVVPEGKQLTEGQCVDVVVDVCPNIEGNQATVPGGKQIVDGQCVDIPVPPVTPPTPPTPPGGGGGNGPIVGSYGGGGGSVLGASTVGQVLGESCGLYMDKHIRLGSKKNNVEQVKKLQVFLNKWMKSNLPVNGVYDSATFEQVKAFQAKYGEDILKPWGTNTPTGIVYLATLRKINKLECPDLSLELPALIPWSKNPNAQ